MEFEENEVIRRTLILAVIIIIVIGFVLVNASFRAGIIYAVLVGLSLILIFNWDKFIDLFEG